MGPADEFSIAEAGLMKALNDTYVPTGTSSDNMATMIHQVIRGHRINFYDDELPSKGGHTTRRFTSLWYAAERLSTAS